MLVMVEQWTANAVDAVDDCESAVLRIGVVDYELQVMDVCSECKW